MRAIVFILLITSMASCKKSIQQIDEKLSYINIEDFRKPGMSDYETFMAAYDSVPNYSNVRFADKVYTFNHTPVIDKTLNFYGPATLKRENQVIYTLKEPADESSTMLILNNARGIIEGDQFFLTFGQSHEKNTFLDFVTKVSGDTLFLSDPIGVTEENVGIYPAGTTLLKDINFFFITAPGKYPDQGCSFNNLIFDGNRDNNQGSYSWRLNAAIHTITQNITVYRHCKFTNSPGETIVGHNADIRDCTFYNLNGSAFHTSADRLTSTESQIHSYLSDNLFENTNQILTAIGGHSEGAITHSNSGGYYTATGNTFINVGESVLATLYPSVSINDWGTSNIIFTGNKIDGAGRLVQSIAVLPGIIHDVKIEKNTISNVPSFDWTTDLQLFPGITLKDVNGQ